MTSRHSPEGSRWRKWDLHFHTPASFDYQFKAATAQDIVEGLVASNVSVVAVTDHHKIDVPFIQEMQRLGSERLTVLPGIELRSELGGSESVHYIGIFSEICDLEDVWTKLQSLGISAADVARGGDESIYVPFEKGCQKIHELGGIVTVHAGKKSNSLESLTNAQVFKQAIKRDIAQRHVDALEVGRLDDCAGYRQHVFPRIGSPLPMLMCSDNHDIRKYSTKMPMWVKADPTFLGLRQLLNEPDARLLLCDEPPSLGRVRQQATKYVAGIDFLRNPAAPPNAQWFDGTVGINPGLVAVIGRKGSGKSALADILALVGNTHASKEFGFLRPDRFLAPKSKLGSMFEARLTWVSGTTAKRRLDASVDRDAPEGVKYIPQNFLETICAGVSESNDAEFSRELDEVIFSHVPNAQRLGHSALADLIRDLTAATEERIGQLKGEVREASVELVALEARSTPEYRSSLEAQLEQRRLELITHDSAKPAKVPVPTTDVEIQSAAAALSADLIALADQIEALEAEIVVERERERLATSRKAAGAKILARIANLQRTVDRFFADNATDSGVIGIPLTDLVTWRSETQALEQAIADAGRAEVAAQNSVDPLVEGSLGQRLAATQATVLQRRTELDEPNRIYQAYLQAEKEWIAGRAALVGDLDAPSSISGIAGRLDELETVPAAMAEVKGRLLRAAQDILAAKAQLLEQYRTLYAQVQAFIDNHEISKKQAALKVEASIAVNGFVEGMLDMLHLARKGSFYGDPQGADRLLELVRKNEVSTDLGLSAFLNEAEDLLTHDRRDGGSTAVRIADQLKGRTGVADVYHFLYGLSYLQPRFELKWHGRTLDQLSPGERGNLLLLFYLLIDKRDIPLVIDQPEENLDNQTIADMLVPAVKEAKERRQIVMVTHNPNLAVVCDADQVIHASLDKADGNRVRYVSGALENPEITLLILDVLEGTKPAFEKRGSKYELLNPVD